jgi:hypothetical protein
MTPSIDYSGNKAMILMKATVSSMKLPQEAELTLLV